MQSKDWLRQVLELPILSCNYGAVVSITTASAHLTQPRSLGKRPRLVLVARTWTWGYFCGLFLDVVPRQIPHFDHVVQKVQDLAGSIQYTNQNQLCETRNWGQSSVQVEWNKKEESSVFGFSFLRGFFGFEALSQEFSPRHVFSVSTLFQLKKALCNACMPYSIQR